LTQGTTSQIWGVLFVLPFLVLFVAFVVVPALYAVWLSVVRWQPLGVSPFVGFYNYSKMLRDPIFWTALRNSFVYVLMVVPAGMVLALFTAVFIYSLRSSALRQFFQSAFYLPGVVSALAVAIVWRYLFDNEIGLMNYILALVGLPRLNWLGGLNTALPSIALMSLIGGGGGAIIIFVAALGGIPTELYDAALIDGASALRKHFSITLPLLLPPILYVMVMGTIGAFQVFTPVYVLTHGGPLNRTMTVSFLIYRQIASYGDIAPAAATGMLLVVACLGLTVAQFWWFSAVVEY